MKAERIDLKKWKGIYGVRRYASAMRANFHHKEQDELLRKETQWVYNFKQYRKNKESVWLIIKILAEHFFCEDILVVPSSTKGKVSALEELFSSKIIRTRDVEKRKWSHNKDLSADYSSSYEIKESLIKGNRIMLLDDVCTTGKTIEHFRNNLLQKGYEVVPLVLGLNIKLKGISGKETIYIYSGDALSGKEDPEDTLNGIPTVDDLFENTGWNR